jgi:nucleoside-diphosphate-sugar epimerase
VHVGPKPSPRSRRARLLVVGCGDVGLRVLRLLRGRCRVLALTSSPQRVPELRAAGCTPIVADLDRPETLRRAGAVAPWLLHLAPPGTSSDGDPRTNALLRVLARAGTTRRLVYASTTGVYGDAGGAWVDETRAVAPATARALRRVAAERAVRRHGRVHGAAVTVLRVPGIYAFDRDGGNPIDRVRSGAPVLAADDDVVTNRIHADDLARACVAALCRGLRQRVVNVCDDSQLPMGEAMDLVADIAGLPRPPRITRDEARRTLTPMAYSFLAESRRLSNRRLKRELRATLHHPTLGDALTAHVSRARPSA